MDGIGLRIKELRNDLKLSQIEFSKRLGIKKSVDITKKRL